jgi:hypothetical protein
MTESQGKKADFLAGILLATFSVVWILTAWSMPRYKQGLYAAPGFPPFVFGIILLVLSLVLVGRSIARGGHRIRLRREHWERIKASAAVRRVLVMGAFIGLFLLLFGKIPFLALSFLFLFGTIWFFKGARLWVNAVVSIAASTTIWYIFSVVFMVPLP